MADALLPQLWRSRLAAAPDQPRLGWLALETLLQTSAKVFCNESPKVLRDNFRFVLRAYTEVQALESCRFVQSLGEGRFCRGAAQLPNTALMGYFLAKLWQRDFGERANVPIIQVLNQPMGLALLLGLDQGDLLECLQKLETQGLLQRTDQDGDIVLTRCWQDPLFLLRKAYSSV